jgi:hypothetical protein
MEDGNGTLENLPFPYPISLRPLLFSGRSGLLPLPLAATLQVNEAEAADQERRYCEKH